MGKESVLLALPRLGAPELESCVAAFVNASDDRFAVQIHPRSCSLLAYGFNQAWCSFCNGGYDWFAMLHADVSPQGPWLDLLAEAALEGGYHAIHAPCAIKDGRGLTSTALGRYDQGPFDPVRRLTVYEMLRLPEVFGYAEAAEATGFDGGTDGCLLPNTGVLMVRREGFPLNAFPGFQIKDALRVKDGKREALVEPEDWGFGRWCALHGLKVGARRVPTHHFGRTAFTTDQEWGAWQWDKNYGTPPAVEEARESVAAAG